MPDVTIRFHRTQWWNLPEETQALIGQYAGPMLPDEHGVITMTLSEAVWEEIQRTMPSNPSA